MSTDKRSILGLPLSPSLPHHLQPDSATPSVFALLDLSKPFPKDQQRKIFEAPSMLRRSRGVSKGAGFAYVTPLLKEFPYEIARPKKPKKGQQEVKAVDGDDAEKAAQGVKKVDGAEPAEEVVDEAEQEEEDITLSDIEAYLSTLEPSLDHPVDAVIPGPSSPGHPAFTSPARTAHYATTKSKLIAVSSDAVEDCLPLLKVGQEGSPEWQELEKVASGELVLVRAPGSADATGEGEEIAKKGYGPWSLAYAGHQFGSFAGQLGDGRATSILTTPLPSDQLQRAFNLPHSVIASSSGLHPSVELQLKGSGRTPFSRFADGLAVLRSTIREYLGSEHLHALGVPTSRGIAMVDAPGVRVKREKVEGAAVLVRANAASWIRIGSFELPAWRDDWEGLRRLVRYAGNEVWGVGATTSPPSANGHPTASEPPPEAASKSLAAALLTSVAYANAKMVAGWQATGFMHGVINTDNVAVSGTTIDFGPYAWMDVFDENKVCNHSDDTGRYSYKMQPSMVLFAIRKLGEVLSEMIGAELSLAAKADSGSRAQVPEGWQENATKADREAWSEEGAEVVNEIQAKFQAWFLEEYKLLLRNRLGLVEPGDNDFREIFSPLLDMMSDHQLDYSLTLRRLAFAPPVGSAAFDGFLERLVPLGGIPEYLRKDAHSRWKTWLETFEARVGKGEEAKVDAEARKTNRLRTNPRFVLRQWVLEEVIAKATDGGEEGKRHLNKVLDMARRPFESYGEGADGFDDQGKAACQDEQVKEWQRLCGVGPEAMLGFQCSCSS